MSPTSGAAVDAEATWVELHARLRAFVASRVADPHAADDLAQEILLRIHRRMGELRDRERLDAWAYRIARNAITDFYRARAARAETPVGDAIDLRLDAGDPEADPGGDDVRAEIARCLTPMVRLLPQPYREAIELTDLGDLTQAAAAEQLELSVPGMKARVQRGRRKLRELLDECCRVATDSRGQPVNLEPRRTCGCGPDGAET